MSNHHHDQRMARKASRKKAARQHREQVEKDQDNRCMMCGHRHFLTLHHIIALEDNGDSNRENLMGLCLSCHQLYHGIGNGCKQSGWTPLGGLSVSDAIL